MSSLEELDGKQLEAARLAAWRQNGEAVSTQEAAREWIGERGLVLFAPRSLQLPAPAPSLVEATLGAAKDAPTAADTGAARSLVARLVGDGSIVPLNLLAVPGDVPDFVVSAQVFSYVFTLRGDKGWKQPPATSGAIAVSPLGLHIYEVLAERGGMTAAELATELGREVTETAILRALSELWSQLRVLPLLDQGSGATLWELTTRRFTKAIKAGANAGQPKALSALVSLYLGQVFAATEEEIATFLSPLTARSRVREVLRALTSSRQLETITVNGKTLLHVPGALIGLVPESAAGVALDEDAAPVAESPKPKKVGTGRIGSYESDKPAKGSLRGKPAKSFAAKGAKSFGAKSAGVRSPGAKSFGAKGTKSFGGAKPTPRYAGAEVRPDSERRPFKRDAAAGGKPAVKREKPSFSKPWDEERKPRAAAAPQDGFTKYRKPAPEDRAPLGPREQAGLPEERRTVPKRATKSFERRTFDGKPAERKPYAKKAFGDKPSFGAKRPYTPRAAEGGERQTFTPRSYEKRSAKPSFDAKRPYTPRAAEGSERPAFKPRSFERSSDRGDKPSFDAKRPYTPRAAEGGERPAFKPRSSERSSDRNDKPSFGAKRPYAPRTAEGGERPAFKPRSFDRSFDRGDKPSFAPKRAFKPRFDDAPTDGAPVERTIPRRPFKPRAEGHENRPFTKAPWVPPTDEGGKRPYGKKPGGFGGKKPFGAKPFGGKRGSSAGAPKPAWRKKPEA